jgi:archaellum component FlaC
MAAREATPGEKRRAMTTEERFERIETILERIAERHEALAQTVEILTSDVNQDAANIRTLARNAQVLHDSIKALENIAATHEQRIDRLEEQ